MESPPHPQIKLLCQTIYLLTDPSQRQSPPVNTRAGSLSAIAGISRATEVPLRFARYVFLIAGVWGVLVLTPLYFMFDRIGAEYPPAITHPDFYYGFIGVGLAWQAAFLIIGSDPRRFRPMMIAAMLEKFSYVLTVSA